MKAKQQLRYIVKLSLTAMGEKYSDPVAVLLLHATLAHESHCFHWIHQVNGPALGGAMIQPNAHKLAKAWDKRQRCPTLVRHDSHDARLIYDMRYAVKIARLLYYSWPIPLPEPTARDCYRVYKQCYNTKAGAATCVRWHANWIRFVKPIMQEILS